MIIGIDVGGTHADGVLLHGGEVLAKKKVAVDHANLTNSLLDLLKALLPERVEELERIHLSTTICTNALVNDTLSPVGMVLQAGPGLNPDFLQCGEHVFFADGAIDHRGQEIKPPALEKVLQVAGRWHRDGIDSIGIVTKFSHRNNGHEKMLHRQLDRACGFGHFSLGHRMSGMPNFPRRVYTTWLNAALKETFYGFREAMERSLQELGVSCPVFILKADGGTMPFASGCELPSQAVQSGPSASVMGALVIAEETGDAGDCILLDIGGTTTDIALFADGTPLLEPYGATVVGRPTLIRSLLTKSVGLGGDSAVRLEDGEYQIGPQRLGKPMAFGGTIPTPTDAMIVLGRIEAGDAAKAQEAMLQLRPDQEAEKTADELLTRFAADVVSHVSEMIEDVFSRPVYTVSAFLERERLQPQKVVVIGGPAVALQSYLETKLALPCQVPADYEVANALGSARARLTLEASLYADTGMGTMSIPEISLMEKAGRSFAMEDAEDRLEEAITDMAQSMGVTKVPEMDFVERLEMNTVRGFSSTGKILTLKAQIRPGLEPIDSVEQEGGKQ